MISRDEFQKSAAICAHHSGEYICGTHAASLIGIGVGDVYTRLRVLNIPRVWFGETPMWRLDYDDVNRVADYRND